MTTFSNNQHGSYAGSIRDDADAVWLLYVGCAIEHNMALELTAIRADDVKIRWTGAIWLLNLLATSLDGYDQAAGRGSAFFARLHTHMRASVAQPDATYGVVH